MVAMPHTDEVYFATNIRRAVLALGVAACMNPSVTRAQEPLPPAQARAIETIVRTLSIEAATYCAPIVAMYNLRYSIAFAPGARSKPGEIWRFDEIATPEVVRQTGYVTPNVNVLYGYGFVDLRREPLVLNVPDSHGRYYVVQMVDMWTNSFAYAGGAATGYGGGRFALVAPGWRGSLPTGITRIEAPTPWIELQPRVFVKDKADLAAAKAVLDQITITGLAEYEGRAAPPAPTYDYEVPQLDPDIASSRMPFKDPVQFWRICSAAMNENPPPEAQLQATLPAFRVLGLARIGRQWTPQSVDPHVLQVMTGVAGRIVGILSDAAGLEGTRNGWVIPPASVGDAGADYTVRAVVAVKGLTANTAQQAVYYDASIDRDGQPLTGAKRYTLTFAGDTSYLASIPPGFWSLTMYDAASGYTVDNPIDRYALGSADHLSKNPDGSFTIYIQHDDPGPDRRSNWLPSPEGPFYVNLRNYAPVPAVYQRLKLPQTFVAPPPLVPVVESNGASSQRHADRGR